MTGAVVPPHAAEAGFSVRIRLRSQVAGWQQRIQFELQMSSAVVDRFLEDAGNALGNAALRYWVLPVLAAGHLGE